MIKPISGIWWAVDVLNGQTPFPANPQNFQAEEVAPVQPVRIFCPNGYQMQKAVEERRGLEYCRTRCGANHDKYTLAENSAACYWIMKEKKGE